MSELQQALIELDMALTGKPRSVCLHTARSQRVTAESWLGDVYYLSDGGYSRVGVNYEFKIHLTCDSLPATQSRWLQAQDAVARVECALHAELRACGWN